MEDSLNNIKEEEKEFIIIITTLSHANDVIKILKDNNIYDNIYTLYGCFWALYFNLNLLPVQKEIKDKYNKIFSAWIYSKKCSVYSRQVKFATDIILSILEKEDSDIPIIIYQPGKVGSNTLKLSLNEYNIDAFRSHGVLYPCEYEKTPFHQFFYDKLRKFERVKIITLVREPIAKDIGHFFQKCHVSGDDVGWLVKGILEKDFQQSFLNYLSIVTPLNFSVGKNNLKNKKIISHIDYIGQKNKNGALWGWYEEELKKGLGIDILNYEFDVERGYSIIQKDNIDMLVIKLECLNKLEAVLAQFIGLSKFHIQNSNEAKYKSYYNAYKQFQRDVKLPKEYVDFHYKNNDYIKHFYSNDEINKFYEKWNKNII